MDTKDKERTRRTQGTKTGASPKSRSARGEAGAKASTGKRPAAADKSASGRRRTAARQGEKTVKRGTAARQEEKTGQRKTAAKTATANSVRRPAASTRTEKTATTRKRRSRTAERKKPSIAQEVVYLPPKPFSRNRLLLRLASVVAVVLALVLGISVFFKVEAVIVYGNQKYSADDILEASGIETGDNLLTFSRAKAGGRIIGKLPFVENVRFGIKLPGTVNIEIDELDVVYAIADDLGSWWLLTSQGRVVEMTDEAGASERTRIEGVVITGVIPGLRANAKEEVTEETDPEGVLVTQPVTVSASQRLDVALTILQHLEHNDILGQMATVDVTNLGSVQMQYGQQFRIKLGDTADLRYKIELAVAAIGQLEPHDRGILDISFLDRDEVVYTPQMD